MAISLFPINSKSLERFPLALDIFPRHPLIPCNWIPFIASLFQWAESSSRGCISKCALGFSISLYKIWIKKKKVKRRRRNIVRSRTSVCQNPREIHANLLTRTLFIWFLIIIFRLIFFIYLFMIVVWEKKKFNNREYNL